MDFPFLETLIVRFHYNGQFVWVGTKLEYFGGLEAMSYIDRDKVSLPEVVGHLRDHCIVSEGALLHWLFPGKELDTGLRVLVDDNACIQMSNATEDGGVADIYVEDSHQEQAADGSDFDYELDEMDGDDSPDQAIVMVEDEEDSNIDTKKGKEVVSAQRKFSLKKSRCKKKFPEAEGSSSDSDYIPRDSCSSEDDDEAAEILKRFKEFKKKMKRGDSGTLDDVVLDGSTGMPTGFEIIDEGYGTPYAKSSEDEDTEDEVGSEGELIRKNDGLPRFKKTQGTPVFSLGMKCKVVGHNRSSCEKRQSANNSGSASTPGHAQSGGPVFSNDKYAQSATSERSAPVRPASNAIVMLSKSGQTCSTSNTSKRPANDIQGNISKKMVTTKASAKVTTAPGGSATMKLSAEVPRSHASSSVTINIISGRASAQVSASEPRPGPGKDKQSNPRPRPMLMLPPWESANL